MQEKFIEYSPKIEGDMAENDNQKQISKDSGKEKRVTLPEVDTKKLKRLYEGVEPKKERATINK